MVNDRLTSHKLASERNCIVNAEASLSAHGKAILLLVKANVANFVSASRSRHSHYIKSSCLEYF